jgi:hypothetical protein
MCGCRAGRRSLAQEPLRDGPGRGARDRALHGGVTVQRVIADAGTTAKPLTQQGANGKFLPKRLLQALLEGFGVHGGAKS